MELNQKINEQQQFTSPQYEVEELKRRIVELEAGASLVNKDSVVRQAVKEHIEKPSDVLSVPHKLTEEDKKDYVQKISALSPGGGDEHKEKEKLHQDQVQELLQLAYDKGILNAVSVVKEMDPHLLDHFHDILVKEFQKNRGMWKMS